jgi:YggT family protein
MLPMPLLSVQKSLAIYWAQTSNLAQTSVNITQNISTNNEATKLRGKQVMIINALQFLLHTLLGLFTIVLLLRFYLQLTNAPFSNPVSQMVVAITSFAVRPLRRIMPSWGRIDLSTLLLAYISQLILHLGVQLTRDFPLLVAGHPVWLAISGLALIGVIKFSLYIFLYAVILQAILSWFNQHTMITSALSALTRPVLWPVQRFVPRLNGIDLSPLVVFILAELILILIVTPMELQLLSLF